MTLVRLRPSHCSSHRFLTMLKQLVPLSLIMTALWACVNFYHMTTWQIELLPEESLKAPSTTSVTQQTDEKPAKGKSIEKPHRVAGLSCPSYPPLDDTNYQQAVDDIVYWRDIPRDEQMTSPYVCSNDRIEKFLTFEPDEGGWNNIRMAMETVVTIAIVTGRTLVLPPTMQVSHMLGHDEKTFGFEDFFHWESLQQELSALTIISFDEFLQRHVIDNNLLGPDVRPPGGQTNWNGLLNQWESAKVGHGNRLWTWWRSVATLLDWQYMECAAVFPEPSGECEGGWKKTTIKDEERVQGYLDDIKKRDKARLFQHRSNGGSPKRAWQVRSESYFNNPTPVDASPEDRLAELIDDRQKLCVYNHKLQDAPVLHARGEQSDTRFLVHFYAFVFLEDWHHDLWVKRFVRDHLRYVDALQCAAARIVAAVREASPTFDSFHIRRTDFDIAYKMIITSAEDIYEKNTKDVLEEGRHVYIATDETNTEWFAPIAKHYKVHFLSNYTHLLRDVNPNHYGMIDQLVASMGDVFFGTFYSTFSGFINRLRGYRHQQRKAEGWELGVTDSWYYSPKPAKRDFRTVPRFYQAVRQAYWRHEFPVCWRDLDHDVDKR